MNGFLNAGIYFITATAIVILAVKAFEMTARYKVWEEIQSGNLAAGMTLGGIIAGIANIMHFAILTNDKLHNAIQWGLIGTVILLVVYSVFELLTPKLNIAEEIKKGNKAVGFLSMVFSIAFSFIIGACIS